MYKRLEPNEACRDVSPTIPDQPNTRRLRFSGSVSDAIWKILYNNQDPDAIFQLDVIAGQAIEYQNTLEDPIRPMDL